MQMVGLYRDPEGKKIFAKTDPSQANVPPTSDSDTIDTLKRRVQELENEVSDIVKFWYAAQSEWSATYTYQLL